MNDRQRHRDGMTRRRQVLGDAHVDRAVAATTPLSQPFQDLITRYAWGEIWTRPHFDTHMRRVLVVATLVALGRWEELRLHVRAGLADGSLSRDDLVEIVLQQSIYCGVPAGNAALEAVREVVAAEPAGKPSSKGRGRRRR